MGFHCGRGLLKRFQTSLSVARVATDRKLWLCQRFTQQHTESAAFWKFSWETQPDGAELCHERRCQPFPKPQEGQLIQRPELVKNCRFFFLLKMSLIWKKKKQKKTFQPDLVRALNTTHSLISWFPAAPLPPSQGSLFTGAFFPACFTQGGCFLSDGER